MSIKRYPCRICGRSTDGADTYVVCAECADEYDRLTDLAGASVFVTPSVVPPDLSCPEPMSPEVEAWLRRLLDDW